MKKVLQRHIDYFDSLKNEEEPTTPQIVPSEGDSDEIEEPKYKKGQKIEFLYYIPSYLTLYLTFS